MGAEKVADSTGGLWKLSRRSPARDDDRPPVRVLFVDPDAASAERLAATMPTQHATAIETTAQSALARMQGWTPDLIITEIDLPDANGLDLVAQLRTAPATQHTLFIVLTARRAALDKIASFMRGADDYLVKPVAPEQLLQHVRSVSRFRRLIARPLTGQGP
jgi:two-component system OmpR family response regulator